MVDTREKILENLRSDDIQSIQDGIALISKHIWNQQETLSLASMLCSLFYQDMLEERSSFHVLKMEIEEVLFSFGESVLPLLVEQLHDADTRSAEHLSRAIQKFGAMAVPFIEKELSSTTVSDYALQNFIHTAGFLSTPDCVTLIPYIIDGAKSSSPVVVAECLKSTGRLARHYSATLFSQQIQTHIVEMSFNALKHPKPIVRQQAVKNFTHLYHNFYLDELNVKQLLTSLNHILGHDKFEWDRAFIVRNEAERVLSKITKDQSDYKSAVAKKTLSSKDNTASHKNESIPNPAQKFNQSFSIIQKKEICPNTYLISIEAPLVAASLLAGQFIMVRPNSTSERIPLSVCGWSKDKGTVDIVVSAVGRTSKELTSKNINESVHDFVGPLGQRSHVEKESGTSVVVGGGYGTGAIIPTAKDCKMIGNRVVGIVGARNKDLLILTDELRNVCDEVIVTTNDGSAGLQGLVTDALKNLREKESVSSVLAVGPVPMMKAVAEATRGTGIRCQVSLNALMVDGTGMCGACRVTVGGKTKFACFHGPDFNGHDVHFEELQTRLRMFAELEKKAMLV